MVKISVMYPYSVGARFDHDYYRERHVPFVVQRMGPACKAHSIDKGLTGGRAGTPPLYVAACHVVCDSMEAFDAAFGPSAREIAADTPNYTDIKPLMQVSEIF
ncbi:MAG TPA: EthD family reductase [Caldimonas sp.]